MTSPATTRWRASDVSDPLYSGEIEFQDESKEWHHFHLIVTESRVVFGGACNLGFLESGYLLREEGESMDEGLRECMEELECYYNDGPQFTNRIVYNERM